MATGSSKLGKTMNKCSCYTRCIDEFCEEHRGMCEVHRPGGRPGKCTCIIPTGTDRPIPDKRKKLKRKVGLMGKAEREAARKLKIGQWRGKIKKETYGVIHCEGKGCSNLLPDKGYQRAHCVPSDVCPALGIPPSVSDQRWNLKFTCSPKCNHSVEIQGLDLQISFIKENYPAWKPEPDALKRVSLLYDEITDQESIFWPPHDSNEEYYNFQAKKDVGYNDVNFYPPEVQKTFLYHACPDANALLKECNHEEYAPDQLCSRCGKRAKIGELLQHSHQISNWFGTRELGLTSKILSDPRNIVPAHRNVKGGKHCNDKCELSPLESLKFLKDIIGIKEDELPTYVQPWLYQMWNSLWV
jgi:hypothetical protein